MQRELAALPGVIEVGVGSTMPLRSSQIQLEVKAEGKTLSVGEAVAAGRVSHRRPGLLPRRRDSAAQADARSPPPTGTARAGS